MNFIERKYYLNGNILSYQVCCAICEADNKSYVVKDLFRLKYLAYIFDVVIVSKNDIYDSIKIYKTCDLFFELVKIKRDNNILQLDDFLKNTVQKEY